MATELSWMCDNGRSENSFASNKNRSDSNESSNCGQVCSKLGHICYERVTVGGQKGFNEGATNIMRTILLQLSVTVVYSVLHCSLGKLADSPISYLISYWTLQVVRL